MHFYLLQISYVPVQNDAISVGDPPSGFVVGTSRDVSVIRNLSINSLYNISIFASTSVGPGDVAMETGQTEEDGIRDFDSVTFILA